MVEWHLRSIRKPSGGRNYAVNARDKKAFEKGGVPAHTRIAEADKHSLIRSKGGLHKVRQLTALRVQVAEAGSGKPIIVNLLTVKENNANRQFPRRNVLTKGAIVEVETASGARLARITSRPGQSGTVSGVFLNADERKAFEVTQTKEKTKKPRKTKGIGKSKRSKTPAPAQ